MVRTRALPGQVINRSGLGGTTGLTRLGFTRSRTAKPQKSVLCSDTESTGFLPRSLSMASHRNVPSPVACRQSRSTGGGLGSTR